jgi:hypothetical protein
MIQRPKSARRVETPQSVHEARKPTPAKAAELAVLESRNDALVDPAIAAQHRLREAQVPSTPEYGVADQIESTLGLRRSRLVVERLPRHSRSVGRRAYAALIGANHARSPETSATAHVTRMHIGVVLSPGTGLPAPTGLRSAHAGHGYAFDMHARQGCFHEGARIATPRRAAEAIA